MCCVSVRPASPCLTLLRQRLGATSPLRYERFLEYDCGCDLGRRGFDSIVIDSSDPASPRSASAHLAARRLSCADRDSAAYMYGEWSGGQKADSDCSRRLAEADFHSCLARSSEATVAVLHGRPVGVILARVDINVPKRLCLLPNRHHRHIIRALFPLLFSTAGRSGIAEMLRINRVDRRLIRGAKNRYDAEVTLFLVDERIRGGGVGGFLFDDLLERFRRVGVRRYYLFTDTGCNVGFYTRRGLTHRREEKVEWDDGGSTVFYLEEGTV